MPRVRANWSKRVRTRRATSLSRMKKSRSRLCWWAVPMAENISDVIITTRVTSQLMNVVFSRISLAFYRRHGGYALPPTGLPLPLAVFLSMLRYRRTISRPWGVSTAPRPCRPPVAVRMTGARRWPGAKSMRMVSLAIGPMFSNRSVLSRPLNDA